MWEINRERERGGEGEGERDRERNRERAVSAAYSTNLCQTPRKST